MVIRSRLQDWMKLKPKARDKEVARTLKAFMRKFHWSSEASGVRLVEILRLVNEEVAEHRKEPGHKQKVTISSLRSTIAALEKCVDRHTKALEHLKEQLEKATDKCRNKIEHKQALCEFEIRKIRKETKIAIEHKNQTIGKLYSEIEQLKDKLPKGPAAGILGRKLEPHDAKVR